VAIAKGALQPTLRGFYNLSTRVGYADRIVGTELDALNPTSVFGFVEEQNVLRPNSLPVLGKAAPFLNQFSDNKGQSLVLRYQCFNGFSVRNNVERSKVSLEI
jgi:outer membrane protein